MGTVGVAPALSVTDRGVIKRKHAALWLLLVDLAAAELALILGWLLRFGWLPLLNSGNARSGYLALALGVLTLPLVYASVGLYPGYRLGSVQRLKKRVYSTLLVFVILLGWNVIYESGSWSRAVLLITMCSSLALLPACEALGRRLLSDLGTWGTPVVVVGASKAVELVVSRLKKEKSLGLLPIAILDDDPQTWGTSVQEVPVYGPLSLAAGFRDKAQIVLLASGGLERHRLLALVEGLSFPTVILVPDLVGVQSLWTVSRDLGGILGLELQKNLLVPTNRVLKRILDCALAIPLSIIALPIVLLSAICIKLISPGPAFFRQKREGQDGTSINIWKLRTMYPNADDLLRKHLETTPDARFMWERYYKLRKDPRILPGIGTILRRLSIDELPQLWNVLMGEMSLVGPRPFPYYHLEGFSETFRALRRSVTPGLTGLWQVSERSDGDLQTQEAQDTYYIRNWSLWFDIYLLIKTIEKLLRPNGAY